MRETLETQEVRSHRRRGLSHEVLVYFVMVMVLYANVAYEEELHLVIEGLRLLQGDGAPAPTARIIAVTKAAISLARFRVG